MNPAESDLKSGEFPVVSFRKEGRAKAFRQSKKELSEQRAEIFSTVFESQLIEMYDGAEPDMRFVFCSASAGRGLSVLIPEGADRQSVEDLCERLQRQLGSTRPIRLFDETGELRPFAARVIDEVRPRLQNGSARRRALGSSQNRLQRLQLFADISLRTMLYAVIMDGLRQGILSIACVYTFCRATDLRKSIWATGLFSRRGVARDGELVGLIERIFWSKGKVFLAPDGNLSDAAIETFEDVRIQIRISADRRSQHPQLRAFRDFEREPEEQVQEEQEEQPIAFTKAA
jgi:hypothetical protein